MDVLTVMAESRRNNILIILGSSCGEPAGLLSL